MKLSFSTIRASFGFIIVLFVAAASAERPYDLAGIRRYPIKRASGVAFTNPASNGGSQLDSSAGLGEPLNVIISGLSSPEVLTTWGIITWARSIGFSTECFGFHIGNPQTANLGDGRGWVNETAVIRYDYENALAGTCIESLTGGNHFRFWNQATTRAYFLAVSVEDWAGEHHNIVPDGYDIGRDSLVVKATGSTKYLWNRYSTTSYYLTGLLSNGTAGINHNISIDGAVAVLTITKTDQSTKPTSGALLSLSPPGFSCCILIYTLVILALAI